MLALLVDNLFDKHESLRRDDFAEHVAFHWVVVSVRPMHDNAQATADPHIKSADRSGKARTTAPPLRRALSSLWLPRVSALDRCDVELFRYRGRHDLP